jgi:hypothetical protein
MQSGGTGSDYSPGYRVEAQPDSGLSAGQRDIKAVPIGRQCCQSLRSDKSLEMDDLFSDEVLFL